MKASKTITLATALVALSVSLAACSDEPETPPVTADCVQKQPDGTLKAVDDDLCDDSRGGGSSFVWIYGGHYSNGHVTGGSHQKPANTNISSRSGKTIVGGFGQSGRSVGS